MLRKHCTVQNLCCFELITTMAPESLQGNISPLYDLVKDQNLLELIDNNNDDCIWADSQPTPTSRTAEQPRPREEIGIIFLRSIIGEPEKLVSHRTISSENPGMMNSISISEHFSAQKYERRMSAVHERATAAGSPKSLDDERSKASPKYRQVLKILSTLKLQRP